jgi:hypothetical protein
MKGSVLILSVLFFVIAGYTSVPSTYADNGNHNGNDNGKDTDCIKHPTNPNCTVSVPEFGAIPGVIAFLASTGSFLFLRRKKN